MFILLFSKPCLFVKEEARMCKGTPATAHCRMWLRVCAQPGLSCAAVSAARCKFAKNQQQTCRFVISGLPAESENLVVVLFDVKQTVKHC